MADENKIIDLETLSHFKTKQDLYNLEKFKLKSDSTELKGAVRYDTAQVLTEEQKAQARANIGVPSNSGNGEGSTVANKFDEEGKLKAEYLPDMIEALKPLDDVVEGYLNSEDGLFYTTGEHTDQIESESGKIYLDLNSNTTYRWGGTQYILIGGGSGGSAEDEIVIIEFETFDEEEMTGTISEESLQKIQDNLGVRPIYLYFSGVLIPYNGIEGFVLSAGYYCIMFELNPDTRQLTFAQVEYASGDIIKNDFDGGGDELAYTVPSRFAVMRYIRANCVSLDSNNKVPAINLPSYVDDVIEGYYGKNFGDEYYSFYELHTIGSNLFNNKMIGETGKIYLDLLTNNIYRWSGSQYVRINPDSYTVATNEDINSLFT